MTEQTAEPTGADERCVETIRFLSADAVQKANSGHPGMPMAMAPVAHVLFSRHLKFDPADPAWPDRDRFVLSAGHGSMLLYSVLHLAGYDLSLDDLKQFRQWGSKTPGHPEHGHTPGVETTTGPLGQGIGNAVGMAMAETFLAATFADAGESLVDHRTYVIVGDGDLMEGVASEVASLAGHLALGKLIVLYDDNHITIDGPTDLAFTEDVLERFDAYGWHTLRVDDANDLDAVDEALAAAKAAGDRPSLIAVRSHIGYGAPTRQDTSKAHGEPLGADELKVAKERLGWPVEPSFLVPDEAREPYRVAAARGAAARAAWLARLAAWRTSDPEAASRWDAAWRGEPAPGWEDALPSYGPDAGAIATRVVSGAVINAVAPYLPTLFGGSADLAPSNNTLIKGVAGYQADDRGARNVHFGVREHGMAAAANGLALHGGIVPYVATFFVFTDYMRPSMRLAALMGLPVKYVLTHDSIGLGEDGPTHQPVEHLAALRAMPGLTVLRPGDATETVEAWKVALHTHDRPVALVLTRQGLPVIDRSTHASAAGVARGGYVLADAGGTGDPDVIIIATGSEVQLALEAQARLAADGVGARIVSMPSRELFAAQDVGYRESVLPAAVTARLAVEAGVSFGWGDIVGLQGDVVGLDHFGASAPAGELFAHFGLTADAVYTRARALVAR